MRAITRLDAMRGGSLPARREGRKFGWWSAEAGDGVSASVSAPDDAQSPRGEGVGGASQALRHRPPPPRLAFAPPRRTTDSDLRPRAAAAGGGAGTSAPA